ncbi:MAG: chloride channel protein [Myxococcales bacterium]|nr:chloride channel protein [Myxococcales bacterium]
MSARLSTVVERAFSAASEKASDTFRRTYDRFLRFTGLGSFGRQTPLIAIGMALGGLAGLIAAGLILMVHGVEWALWDQVGPRLADLSVFGFTPEAWLIVPLIPAIGGLGVGVFKYFFPKDAGGHGVPEVMEAVAVKGAILSPRTILTRSITSAGTIGSGGSVGYEGPIIHIGAAAGSAIGQLLKLPASSLRVLVAAGAAAGMAAVFNAPMAGVIFSIEIILGEFNVNAFSPIIAASVFATATARSLVGDIPQFIVPRYEVVSSYELLLYIVLGAICGLIALLFVRSLHVCEEFFRARSSWPAWLKPAIGGLVVGAIGFVLPEVMGHGDRFINQALRGELLWSIMLPLIFLKIAATAVTLGSGGSGGVFSPALFIGAMTGGAFGYAVNLLFPEYTAPPGAYALVAMGAVNAAAAHAPMTNIFMLFELTGDYKIILPIMIACIVATTISRGLSADSIYTGVLRRLGVNIVEGREVGVLASLYVGEAMAPNPECVTETMTLRDLKRFITHSRHTNFPLVDDAGRLAGMVSLQNFRAIAYEDALEDLIVAGEVATRDVPTVLASENLNHALNVMGESHVELLPVVDPMDRHRIIGVLGRSDIINAYARALVLRGAGEERPA